MYIGRWTFTSPCIVTQTETQGQLSLLLVKTEEVIHLLEFLLLARSSVATEPLSSCLTSCLLKSPHALKPLMTTLNRLSEAPWGRHLTPGVCQGSSLWSLSEIRHQQSRRRAQPPTSVSGPHCYGSPGLVPGNPMPSGPSSKNSTQG